MKKLYQLLTFRHWSIRYKLLASFLLVILVFVAAVFASYLQISAISSNVESIESANASLVKVHKVADLGRDLYIHVADIIISGSETDIEKFHQTNRRLSELIMDLKEELASPLAVQLLNAVSLQQSRMETGFNGVVASWRQQDREALRRWDIEMTTVRTNIISLTSQLVEDIQSRQAQAIKDLQKALHHIVQQMIMGIVGALALAGGIALVSGHFMRTPLARLVGYSRQMAAGNLIGDPLYHKDRDEIGQLVEAFNEMRKSLRGLIQSGIETSQQVAAASQELAASAGQMEEAAGQVAESVQEIARGAQEQAVNAQSVAQSMEKLLQRVKAVHASSEEMKAGVETVFKVTTAGDEAIHAAEAQMAAISTQVGSISILVDNLGRRSRDVEQIVELITGIADQTNLLALNAAIEAARAGEHGRGFAVVAEEVRKLAEQSAQAAGRIIDTIKEMRSETDKAMRAMGEGTKEVEQGSDLLRKTSGAFAQIRESIGLLGEGAQKMVSLAREMELTGQEVGAQVQNIAAVTEEATAGAEEVSAAVEQQRLSVKEIAASAAKLSDMAEETVKVSGKFQI
ncbi:MAG: methyl-accepting chemotaxis protein [Bacillota bacterium]